MSRWEENIRKVIPYTPGEQPNQPDMIKLNTNENPYPREFDSWISEKVPAGRIKPAFFVSNFWFLSIVFYCNVL